MVDKNIHEKDFLPGQKLPIEILPVKEAWTDLKNKLEDEMPLVAAIPSFADAKPKSSLQKRVLRLSLLLLLLFISWLVINELNNEDRTTKEVAEDEQKSIGNGQSATDKKGDGSLPATKDQSSAENISAGGEKNKPPHKKDVTVLKDLQEENKLSGASIPTKKPSAIKGNRRGKQYVGSLKEKQKRSLLNTPGKNDPKEIAANNTTNEKPATIDEPVAEKNIASGNPTDMIIKKKDPVKGSIAKSAANAEEQTPQYKPVISAGLQWNFQLPVYGADNYFKGSTATSQPYRVLLPGAWVSVQSEKRLLRAEVNPFYSSLLPAKPFGIFTTYSNTPDTLITITETKTLSKTFGIFISADYNYNFSRNWWAGGGIHAYWQRKGITSGRGIEEKRSVINGGAVANTFNRNYMLTKKEWENFRRFQLGIHGEIFYSSKKMQTGFRIGLPVGSVAKQQGQRSSLRSEILFRLPLYFSGQ